MYCSRRHRPSHLMNCASAKNYHWLRITTVLHSPYTCALFQCQYIQDGGKWCECNPSISKGHIHWKIFSLLCLCGRGTKAKTRATETMALETLGPFFKELLKHKSSFAWNLKTLWETTTLPWPAVALTIAHPFPTCLGLQTKDRDLKPKGWN